MRGAVVDVTGFSVLCGAAVGLGTGAVVIPAALVTGVVRGARVGFGLVTAVRCVELARGGAVVLRAALVLVALPDVGSVVGFGTIVGVVLP